ncbi:MAG: sodium:calcium antiporter [Clostridia bacterium]|nr:sodium:calcium antiporter [Clostridia bacterium]
MFDVSGWPIWSLIVLFIVGLILIVKGGDIFVDAAAWMAEVSGIPQFIIGATIVSVATTLPELLVSCFGAARATGDMTANGNALAVGNAVGSVTANTGLIMAISIICIPAVVKRSQYAFKSILLILATVILYLSSLGASFSLYGAIVLLFIFVISTIESILTAKNQQTDTDNRVSYEKKDIPINIGKFLGGALGIVFGAEFLVDSATELAVKSGISQAVISATIVAIGTSLPEFVTTITAIVKKQSSLSVGNIIGANLIDIAIILPICSLISKNDLSCCPQNIYLDIPLCLLVLAIAIIPMLILGKFSRWQGICLMILYAGYVVTISFFNPFPIL